MLRCVRHPTRGAVANECECCALALDLFSEGRLVTALGPEALAALTRTWAAILQGRYPELRGIRVSVVGEDERLGLPAVSAARGKGDILALPNDVKAPFERRRAA
jgi:hypothetical protein